MKHYVYEIVIAGTRRYVGITNNIKARELQHKRGYKLGKKKLLYTMLRQAGVQDFSLNIIKEYANRSDAEKMEALLILLDYFKDKKLWQREPTKFKYF